MDKIKFGLFDVFVYTIPGIIILFGIYLLSIDLTKGIEPFINNLGKLLYAQNFNTIALSIFIAYLLGFVLHYFGYRYFVFVSSILWKKRFGNKLKNKSHLEAKYVIVRHHSKENFVYVDQWNTYRGMSFNLSLAFFIVGLEIAIKLIMQQSFQLRWLFFVMLVLLMSVVTLRRAVTFHFWSLSTLEESFLMLEAIKILPQDCDDEKSPSDQVISEKIN